MLGATGVAAVVLPLPLVLITIVLLAGGILADVWAARRFPTTTRHVPELMYRGVPVPFSVDVHGQATRTRVRQPAIPDIDVNPSEGDAGLTGTITPQRRGRHVLPPLAVRSTGPLRLARAVASQGMDHEVLVYPDMPSARRLAAAVRTGRFRTEGLRNRGPIGLGTEFESIREYTEDDDIRSVNWQATGRMQRPMVNVWRVEQDRDVICVIDSGRLMGAPIGSLTRLDAAVDATAAIGAVADVVGDRVGVIVFDDGIRRQLSPRRRGGEAVSIAIFDVEPSKADSDYLMVFQRLTSYKRAFVLVLTDLVEEAAARPLIEALSVLSRHHAVAVASVRDPDLTAVLTTTPSQKLEVAKMAVATDVADARDRVSRSLVHRNVAVIDASHDALSRACVATYLRAKSVAAF
ncbi:MAG: DUF58 domain-containing protein [Acidimicrobiia bacterium]|nr:MAG: DUF58 domain-containing protein [Acidimicrobiia bacterium]